MARLIDADALIPSEVHTVVVRKADGKEVWESVLYAEQIDNAPTIDAEPVRHGLWIPCTKKGMPITELGVRQGEKWYGYKCSECKAIYKGNALTESPYCQHCGARMDGGKE